MGRTLGVVGVGNIGRELFKLAQPFGMKLLGCDPNVAQSSVAMLGVSMVDKDTLLRQSDYISINTLLDDKTRGLIGAREFAPMKPGAYFINTARGPVAVESALIDALKNNRIAGAAIDVFEQEAAFDRRHRSVAASGLGREVSCMNVVTILPNQRC